MSNILVVSVSSTTQSNLNTALTGLGHTVTAISVLDTSADYSAYDLAILAHYDANQISSIKSQLVDIGIPIVFGSQANQSGVISNTSQTLITALGLGTSEYTTGSTSLYVVTDHDNVFASQTLPWSVGGNGSYSSYMLSPSGNTKVFGYDSSSASSNISLALLSTGDANSNGVSYDCNIAFVGSLGLNWTSTSLWLTFLDIFIDYMIASNYTEVIEGTVKDANDNLIERTVGIYNRTTMNLREKTTSVGGSFSFTVPKGTYFVICLDELDGTVESLIHDKLIVTQA